MQFRSLALACLALPLVAAPATAHDEPAPGPAASGTAAPAADSGAASSADNAVLLEKKTLKSMFKNLRFEEDWSALKDKDTTTDNIFPEAKYVDLSDGWYATFGGQERLRMMWEDNKKLTNPGTPPGKNDYTLQRLRLNGDLHMGDDARIYMELISAHIYGNEFPPIGTDRNALDVQNLFLDLNAKDSVMRIGRFEMAEGAQRLIGTADWGNTRRTFQGLMGKLKTGDWNSDIFVTRPVITDPHFADETLASRNFSGIYSTAKFDPASNVDVYGLALNDHGNNFTAGDGTTNGIDCYTLGARYWGKQDAWDYEAEAGRQFGDFAGDNIRAYMWTLVGGYTVDAPCQPRFALDLDYASGDSDPKDSTHGTWNQLFPSAHPYFGYLDLIGRQNIMSVMPSVTVKVADTASFRMSYSDFHLANPHDSLYGTNGAPVLTDASASSGDNVGKEVDLSLKWTPAELAPNSDFLFGLSTFSPDRFTESTGNGQHVQLVYVQYTFTF